MYLKDPVYLIQVVNKRKMHKYLIVIFLFTTISASSQNNTNFDSLKTPDIYGGDGKEFVDFFKKFRSLAKRNDSVQIAKQVFYPFHAALEGYKGTVDIYDKKSFLKFYHLIFNERMRSYIISENLDSIFSNWEGIALGRGNLDRSAYG